MKKVLYILGGLLVFSFLISKCGDSEEKTTTAPTSEKIDTTKTEVVQPKENWSYSEDVDKMTSAKTNYAECLSTNRIDFEFPYNEDGGSAFSLLVRHTTKNEVLLSVTKGQFLTGISGEKTIRMKFDDEKPINVGVSGASDGSADILFLSPTSKIIAKLKSAKKVIIEPEFYQAGFKQVEFDTEGLKWKY